jgi:hypothetical protein
VRVGASAHQVTLAALVAGLGSALAIATGTRGGFVAGVALGHAAFWLDHVDGQVARWRGTASLEGVYFDYLMHHACGLALGFGLGFGLAARTGDSSGRRRVRGRRRLDLPGPAQRLPLQGVLPAPEAEDRSYRVAGGAGGRPAPPLAGPGAGGPP